MEDTSKKEIQEDLEKWKADFEKEAKKYVEDLNKLMEEAEKQKNYVAVFGGLVKKWGGSAHIQIPKKYVDHEARILITNKKAVKPKKENDTKKEEGKN